MEKVMTSFKDMNFMYHVYAYRQLTRDECMQTVTEYLAKPDHEFPQDGKVIEVYTEIH